MGRELLRATMAEDDVWQDFHDSVSQAVEAADGLAQAVFVIAGLAAYDEEDAHDRAQDEFNQTMMPLLASRANLANAVKSSNEAIPREVMLAAAALAESSAALLRWAIPRITLEGDSP